MNSAEPQVSDVTAVKTVYCKKVDAEKLVSEFAGSASKSAGKKSKNKSVVNYFSKDAEDVLTAFAANVGMTIIEFVNENKSKKPGKLNLFNEDKSWKPRSKHGKISVAESQTSDTLLGDSSRTSITSMVSSSTAHGITDNSEEQSALFDESSTNDNSFETVARKHKKESKFQGSSNPLYNLRNSFCNSADNAYEDFKNSLQSHQSVLFTKVVEVLDHVLLHKSEVDLFCDYIRTRLAELPDIQKRNIMFNIHKVLEPESPTESCDYSAENASVVSGEVSKTGTSLKGNSNEVQIQI